MKTAREVVSEAMDEELMMYGADDANADQIIAALENAGYVIVPKQPTDKMLHAMTMQPPTWDDDASRRKWKAALSTINP